MKAARERPADLCLCFYRPGTRALERNLRQGVTDFLSVIGAERSLASAEDNLAQSDRTICINLIALYKSLGGGWQIDPTVAVAQASRL